MLVEFVSCFLSLDDPGFKLSAMPATVEELQGLIAGLSEVVKVAQLDFLGAITLKFEH